MGIYDVAVPPLIGAIEKSTVSAKQLRKETTAVTEYVYKLYDQFNHRNYWVMYFELKKGNLPYFIVDSIFNRVEIKETFKDYQEVHLEGGFGDYFKLFVPSSEQIDAISAIGPDAMDVLMEYWQDIDLIVANKRIWLVTRGGYKDPEVISTLIEAGNVIQKELLHRARTYKENH